MRPKKLSVIIRPAEEKDIPVLEDLFLQFSEWPLQRSHTLRKIMKEPTSELLVAESNQEIVGLIHQIFFLDPFHAGLNSYITSLFVKETHREKGIGSHLLEKVIENAKKKGVIEVHVDTEEDNTEAIEFYQTHGFKKVGVIFENNL
jgi:ribosomal protein S18 acetylase RimI-like enzyme